MGQVDIKSEQFRTDMEHAAILMAEFEKLNELTQYCFLATAIDTYCRLTGKDYRDVVEEYKRDRAAQDEEEAQFIEL